jgi:hypothetical protein
MRRTAWMVTLMAAAAMLLPAAGPAVAQATVPGPDFNNDGFGDLAVGVPGEDLGTAADAGAVTILFGSSGGLVGAGAKLLTQGNPEPGDSFGFALDVGQFEAGDALVVGAPGEDVGTATGAGAVSQVVDPGGTPDEQLLYQGAGGMAGTPETGDAFGWAIVSNDFNDSEGIDSLAVGVPGEDVGAVADAGVVDVRYAPGFGQPFGLTVLTQDRPEAGDQFGSALADGLGGGGSSQFFYQGVSGLGGVAESVDVFGAAFS